MNEITPVGMAYLAEVVPTSKITYLNLSKNLLGDESIMLLVDRICEYKTSCKMQRLDISSCRVGDVGVYI